MNSSALGSKRARNSPPPYEPFHNNSLPTPSETSPPSSSLTTSASSFRNVSACNRCRLRKNKCDQNLPACSSCEKAGVKCVGFDPVTKREIPRTYVYYLESRCTYLETILSERGIPFAPSEEFDLGTTSTADHSAGHSPTSNRSAAGNTGGLSRQEAGDGHGAGQDRGKWEQEQKKQDEANRLNKLVSNIGMVSVQGASDPRYLGSTSGISFARVVFAAVKSSVSGGSSDRGGAQASRRGSLAAGNTNGTSLRDSFFGLQTKPTIKKAPFPDRELGMHLITLYFQHANPQMPILHRSEFMALFNKAYASGDRARSPREMYMLNIVFAIGAGIILKDSENNGRSNPSQSAIPIKREPTSPNLKRRKLDGQQKQPEEYHASAIVHLESFLGSLPAADRPDGFGAGLEELQAVLLLAGFALLRPVAPGLWYIVGVAVRLGVDLGLHYEDGAGVDSSGDSTGMARSQDIAMEAAGQSSNVRLNGIDAKERGRREWVRDLRRRLWWCVYSFDRLVSTCVGRPFGITDQVITTEFPSILDDEYITTSGFSIPSHNFKGPSYKRVSHHYFRLRLLQSEILQVLQYRQAQQARSDGKNRNNEYMHTQLPSPFLHNFDSFNAWRRNIDRRLWEWKETAPRQQDTTVQFSVQFLELNYWQAVIMLYRQSLSVPPMLAGETNPSDDVATPTSVNREEQEDADEIFLKVAEAGQKILKLYRQLHRVHLVNYTFLATHHLFMAGIGFLYAIWHSSTVRSRLTLDDVDFTVLAATSVLGDLIDKCPPAEACRDAFERMSKATVQMCLSTTGFGSRASGLQSRSSAHTGSYNNTASTRQDYETKPSPPRSSFISSRPPPQFDMNLRDLFPDETQDGQVFGSNLGRWQGPAPPSIPPVQPRSDSYQDRANALPLQQYTSQMAQPLGPSPAIPMNNNAPYENYSFPNDMDFLLTNNTATYTGHSGLDLGFDSEHDWSDGVQMDMFDGFFFGGIGSAGAV